MNSLNYNELQKTYPEFKIPFFEHAEYYISTLLEAGCVSQRPLSTLQEFDNQEDIQTYKYETLEDTLCTFRLSGWDLNSLADTHPLLNSAYSLKEFSDYKTGKFYVSIDLKEANWQAFKRAFALNLTSWEDFMRDEGAVDFLAESKSFRQFVLGNTNPKRLQKIQCAMMQEIIDVLPDYVHPHLVGRKSDELIFEYDFFPSNVFHFQHLPHLVKSWVKVEYFTIDVVSNYGDSVKIKTVFNLEQEAVKKKLVNVSGNRFFIHLKTLLLNKALDERDLYFIQDNKKAMWLVDL